jgi:hypothetical protein
MNSAGVSSLLLALIKLVLTLLLRTSSFHRRPHWQTLELFLSTQRHCQTTTTTYWAAAATTTVLAAAVQEATCRRRRRRCRLRWLWSKEEGKQRCGGGGSSRQKCEPPAGGATEGLSQSELTTVPCASDVSLRWTTTGKYICS